MKSAPPWKCSGMTCNYQFQLADSEKQPFGPPSGVHTSRNHSFFSRQFESGTLLPNPYACQKMMHADSGNLSGRCKFSRSTTLLATPRCFEVGVRVVSRSCSSQKSRNTDFVLKEGCELCGHRIDHQWTMLGPCARLFRREESVEVKFCLILMVNKRCCHMNSQPRWLKSKYT